MTNRIPKARQHQIAIALKRGMRAASYTSHTIDTGIVNPFADACGSMPDYFKPVQAALWHAFLAGVNRADGNLRQAGTILRNARLFMRAAAHVGRMR